MKLFGFELSVKRQEVEKAQEQTFVTGAYDDGATSIASPGSLGSYIDLEGDLKNEAQLITKYREMVLYPECDAAVEEIVNESICVGEENDIVKIVLDDLTDTSKNIKSIIEEEFKGALQLLNFSKKGHELYRKWYVDGRLYFHAVVEEKKEKEGIQRLVYIDPRKMRKVTELEDRQKDGTSLTNPLTAMSSLTKVVNTYFLYNEKGFDAINQAQNGMVKSSGNATSIRIAPDSIVHVTSGATDSSGSLVLSYLHKAIKPLNQLRTLEDATVIYRLVRAPERRVWTVDVGEMPKAKADQYIQNLITMHKNKLSYNAQDGTIYDSRKFITMLEDFWLPVRNGKGVEVDTLPSGQLTGVLDDVLYFQKKLFSSLNIPVNRLQPDNVFNSGRDSEITRDELKFAKFIFKIRNKFCDLFLFILERQLVLKGVMTWEDWHKISGRIKFDFAKDNVYAELKDLSLIQDRLNTLQAIDPYASKYYSHAWVRTNILKQTEKDVEEIDQQIKGEAGSPQYNPELLAPEINPDGDPMYSNDSKEKLPPPSDTKQPGGPASVRTAKPATKRQIRNKI